MLEQFKEYDDRYETEIESDSINVLVCVDKADISDLTETLIEHIFSNLENIMDDALKYFNKNKKSYGVEYIDDLVEPQVILGADGFSVYWCSDKGEEKGEAIVGIDYLWPECAAQGLTIGA